MVCCCLWIRSRISFWFCSSVGGSADMEIDSLMHVVSVHLGSFIVDGVFGGFVAVIVVEFCFGVIGLLCGVMLLLLLGVILGDG